MNEPTDPGAELHLDCQTCLAVNTTACNDCVVTHLLANDDGPIQFVTTGAQPLGHVMVAAPERASPADDDTPDPAVTRALSLLSRAGLLDDEPVWVDRSEFESDVSEPGVLLMST